MPYLNIKQYIEKWRKRERERFNKAKKKCPFGFGTCTTSFQIDLSCCPTKPTNEKKKYTTIISFRIK